MGVVTALVIPVNVKAADNPISGDITEADLDADHDNRLGSLYGAEPVVETVETEE